MNLIRCNLYKPIIVSRQIMTLFLMSEKNIQTLLSISVSEDCCSRFHNMSKNSPVKISTWWGFGLHNSHPGRVSLSLFMQTQSFCVRGSRSFEMFRCFAKDYVAESVRITEWLHRLGCIQRFKIETEFHVNSRHSFMLFMAAVCLLLLYNTSHLTIFNYSILTALFWNHVLSTWLEHYGFCTNMCVFLVIISVFLHVSSAPQVSSCISGPSL